MCEMKMTTEFGEGDRGRHECLTAFGHALSAHES